MSSLRRHAGRATGAAARVARAVLPGSVVLLYHRVVDLPPGPFQLSVAPARFAEQLDVVAAGYAPVGLAELGAAIRRRRPPRRGVAITFDDGYADNLTTAKPLLAARGLPATVFVATAYTDGDREFWWDELERLLALLDPGRPLEFRVGGEQRRWDPREMARLQYGLRLSSAEAIEDALAELRTLTGAGKLGVRPSHRAMSVTEVGELAADGLIDVGAHSRWHANLRTAPRGVQHEEIAGSRRDLEQWLDRPVRGFSYPFGRRGRDYDRVAVRAARDAGFDHAASRAAWPAGPLDSPLEIPRFVVPDIGGAAFERWLAGCFAGLNGGAR